MAVAVVEAGAGAMAEAAPRVGAAVVIEVAAETLAACRPGGAAGTREEGQACPGRVADIQVAETGAEVWRRWERNPFSDRGVAARAYPMAAWGTRVWVAVIIRAREGSDRK